jgi:hypothetical protein
MKHPWDRRSVFVACQLLAAAGLVQAQPAQPAFEAASIRVDTSGNPGFSVVRRPDGITATNAPFEYLLEVAYQTKLVDWSHVPDSLRFERYDMLTKAGGKLSGERPLGPIFGSTLRNSPMTIS